MNALRERLLQRALAAGSEEELVGAVVLSRAVDDDALSDEISSAVPEALGEEHPNGVRNLD